MRTFRVVLLAALAVVLCLSACRRKDRIIPRGEMVDIYAELFLADQWMGDQGGDLFMAMDTMRFYEPIFNKYGYTTLDFRNSANYYLQDARRFARILQRASIQLEEHAKRLERLSEDIEKSQNEIDRLKFNAHMPPDLSEVPQKAFYERVPGVYICLVQDEWGAWIPGEEK